MGESSQQQEIGYVLSRISPRAAVVTLLLFDRVITRYENETGRVLSAAEQGAIVGILREIVRQECRAPASD